MQNYPSETHFTPEIELRHAELVVNLLSLHYLTLHTDYESELFISDDCQKHSPSVPITHPA